eukprot:gene6527-8969_t
MFNFSHGDIALAMHPLNLISHTDYSNVTTLYHSFFLIEYAKDKAPPTLAGNKINPENISIIQKYPQKRANIELIEAGLKLFVLEIAAKSMEEELGGSFVLTTSDSKRYIAIYRSYHGSIFVAISYFSIITFTKDLFSVLKNESYDNIPLLLLSLCELPMLPEHNLNYSFLLSRNQQLSLRFTNMKNVVDHDTDMIAMNIFTPLLLVKAWQALVLEQKVLIISTIPSIITPCCEYLIRLLSPMMMINTYVPLLPVDLLHVIEAPFAYLLGVDMNLLRNKPDIDLSDSLIIDLDNKKIIQPKAQHSKSNQFHQDNSNQAQISKSLSDAILSKVTRVMIGSLSDYIDRSSTNSLNPHPMSPEMVSQRAALVVEIFVSLNLGMIGARNCGTKSYYHGNYNSSESIISLSVLFPTEVSINAKTNKSTKSNNKFDVKKSSGCNLNSDGVYSGILNLSNDKLVDNMSILPHSISCWVELDLYVLSIYQFADDLPLINVLNSEVESINSLKINTNKEYIMELVLKDKTVYHLYTFDGKTRDEWVKAFQMMISNNDFNLLGSNQSQFDNDNLNQTIDGIISMTSSHPKSILKKSSAVSSSNSIKTNTYMPGSELKDSLGSFGDPTPIQNTSGTEDERIRGNYVKPSDSQAESNQQDMLFRMLFHKTQMMANLRNTIEIKSYDNIVKQKNIRLASLIGSRFEVVVSPLIHEFQSMQSVISNISNNNSSPSSSNNNQAESNSLDKVTDNSISNAKTKLNFLGTSEAILMQLMTVSSTYRKSQFQLSQRIIEERGKTVSSIAAAQNATNNSNFKLGSQRDIIPICLISCCNASLRKNKFHSKSSNQLFLSTGHPSKDWHNHMWTALTGFSFDAKPRSRGRSNALNNFEDLDIGITKIDDIDEQFEIEDNIDGINNLEVQSAASTKIKSILLKEFISNLESSQEANSHLSPVYNCLIGQLFQSLGMLPEAIYSYSQGGCLYNPSNVMECILDELQDRQLNRQLRISSLRSNTYRYSMTNCDHNHTGEEEDDINFAPQREDSIYSNAASIGSSGPAVQQSFSNYSALLQLNQVYDELVNDSLSPARRLSNFTSLRPKEVLNSPASPMLGELSPANSLSIKIPVYNFEEEINFLLWTHKCHQIIGYYAFRLLVEIFHDSLIAKLPLDHTELDRSLTLSTYRRNPNTQKIVHIRRETKAVVKPRMENMLPVNSVQNKLNSRKKRNTKNDLAEVDIAKCLTLHSPSKKQVNDSPEKTSENIVNTISGDRSRTNSREKSFDNDVDVQMDYIESSVDQIILYFSILVEKANKPASFKSKSISISFNSSTTDLGYNNQASTTDIDAIITAACCARKQLFAPDDPIEVLPLVQFHCDYLISIRKFEQSHDMLLSLLDSRVKTLTHDHVDTLKTMHSLGILCSLKGEIEPAIDYLRKALSGREILLGWTHADTKASMDSLIDILQDNRYVNEAEKIYRRAISSVQEHSGVEHEDSLTLLSNFGTFLVNHMGDLSEADQILRQAYVGMKKVLGKYHNSTLEALHNLASLNKAKSNYELAEKTYRKVLSGFEKTIGTNHIHYIRATTSFGQVLISMKKYDEAEIHLKKGYQAMIEKFTDENEESLMTLYNIGMLYCLQGRFNEAETVYKKTLSLREKLLGMEHIDTINTVQSLGSLYRAMNKLGDAEDCYGRALAGYEKIFGATHKKTCDTAYEFAQLYNKLYMISKAAEMYKYAFNGYSVVFGLYHARTMDAKKNSERLSSKKLATKN